MGYNDQYYKNIKDRLISVVEKYENAGFKVNLYKIFEIISNKYKIDTSYQIIKSIFNYQNEKVRKIPLPEIVAICDILQVPLNEICRFDSAPTQELNPSWIIPKGTERVALPNLLTNKYYYGKYYCYFYKQKPISNAKLGNKHASLETKIKSAELNIEENDGFTYATLTETSSTKNFEQNDTLENFVYTGKLYYLEKPNQVYTMMMDKEGKRAICLMFDYQNYTKDVMYYRTAAMLTSTMSRHPKPLFEKMIILRKPLNLEDENHLRILRGVLSLESNNLIVKKDIFTKLAKEHKIMNDFEPVYEEYASFNESEIINRRIPWDYNEKKEAILLLRQNSILNIQNVASEDEDFPELMKELQQSISSETVKNK